MIQHRHVFARCRCFSAWCLRPSPLGTPRPLSAASRRPVAPPTRCGRSSTRYEIHCCCSTVSVCFVSCRVRSCVLEHVYACVAQTYAAHTVTLSANAGFEIPTRRRAPNLKLRCDSMQEFFAPTHIWRRACPTCALHAPWWWQRDGPASLSLQVPSIDSASTEGEQPATLTGNIEFQDVTFRYPARDEVVVSLRPT